MICIVCGQETEGKHFNCKYCDRCKKIKHDIMLKEKAIKATNSARIKSQIKNKEVSDLPTCKICGFKGLSLSPHIKWIHNMCLLDYKQNYNAGKEDIYHHSLLERISKKSKEVSRFGKDNPSFNHGGRYSPFSRNFIKYDNMTEEEKDVVLLEIKSRTANSIRNSDKLDVRLSYWLEVTNGDEDEARRLLRERQTTFSLQKCIRNHGEERGTEIWVDRQEKWIKSYKKRNFSYISQELFWELYNKIKDDFNVIKFAQLNENNKDVSGNNNEHKLRTQVGVCSLDFIIMDTMKIIEFDGDYWHGEKRGNKERDHRRQCIIEDMGYKVMRVIEREYRLDTSKVINECLDFIYDR
jgi:hypothetical protein